MAENERQNGTSRDVNAVLAAHVAAGMTVRDAAVAAGVAESTAYRRTSDPAFRARVSESRAAIAAAVLLRAAELATAALNTLEDLLDAGQPPMVRLGAAKAVLTVASDFGEKAETRERLEALENVLAARPKAADHG